MAFFLRMGLFLVLYDWFVVNRWFCWFLSHVEMFGLQSSESFLLLLSHRLCSPLPSPVFSFTLWSFLLAAQQVHKTNPPRWHQISSGTAFLSLQPFVVGEHLCALSVSVTLMVGVIWSFCFKRKPPPHILPSHLCSLQISCVSPEIYGFSTTYRVLF